MSKSKKNFVDPRGKFRSDVAHLVFAWELKNLLRVGLWVVRSHDDNKWENTVTTLFVNTFDSSWNDEVVVLIQIKLSIITKIRMDILTYTRRTGTKATQDLLALTLPNQAELYPVCGLSVRWMSLLILLVVSHQSSGWIMLNALEKSRN